jgi:hypothetical protein
MRNPTMILVICPGMGYSSLFRKIINSLKFLKITVKGFLVGLLLFFTGCHDSSLKLKQDRVKGTVQTVDYRQQAYHFYIGQTKDSIEQMIELNRDFMQDRNLEDSITHYMNIGEDLLTITNNDSTKVLPALFFTFLNNQLTGFVCSINYQPLEKSTQSIDSLLRSVAPCFTRLSNIRDRNRLSSALSLQLNSAKVEEGYSIDTMGGDDIRFAYRISMR